MEELDQLNEKAERFKSQLKAEHQDQFGLTTLGSMKAEIHRIQARRVETKEMISMNRLQLFMDGTVALEQTLVDIGFQEAKQVMAYVWSSVQYLLKLTDTTEKAFDNILDTYERLGVSLISVSEYTRFFREVPKAQECLVNIYKDIQDFHSEAYRLFFTFHTKLWQKLHKPIWKDLQETFNHIAQRLELHASFIKRYGKPYQGNSSPMEDGLVYSGVIVNPGEDHHASQALRGPPYYHADLNKLQQDFDDREEKRKREMRMSAIAWISASTKTKRLHEDFRKMRICRHSGRWLFTSYRAVSEWLKEDGKEHDGEKKDGGKKDGENEDEEEEDGGEEDGGEEDGRKKDGRKKGRLSQSAIWLHGNKGFGKTILASLVIDEVETLRDKFKVIPPNSKTYYFYCQEEDDEHRTYLDILKGILAQMVEQDDYIVPLCHEKMAQGGCNSLSDADTAKSLIDTIVQYNSRQYIIIDGLDECEPAEIRQTAQTFTELVDKCNTGHTEHGRLRLMFMSREVSEIQRHMPEYAIIPLKSTDNADDIRAFVRKRLPEFSRSEDGPGFNLSEEDKMQIESKICYRSEDSFLYAHLAIESLLQKLCKKEIQEEMDKETLCDQLEIMYETLLGNLKNKIRTQPNGERVWEKSKLLLGWLVCAKRPLKWHEMQAILSFEPREARVDFDNLMLKDNVRKYLGSLVHILDGDHIRLIHTTARQHIVKNKHIDERHVQCKLTSLCLRYLSLPSFTKNYPSTDRREHAELGWFSFQDYACSKWHSHINTFMKNCSGLFVTDFSSEEERDFVGALELFLKTHGEGMATEVHAELKTSDLDKFKHLPFYDNLHKLWNQIYTHQKSKDEERNKVGIAQIDKALVDNRAALEKHKPDDKVLGERLIQDFYGSNLFKCSRTSCRYFYVGYDTEKARKKHENRHDRPFPCPVGCNSAPIGFSTNKDKDRHMRIYHTELSEGPSPFEALSRRQATGPARFTCLLCGKNFTRKINLTGHERSHYGERPYKCSLCERAFTRMNDCRRHERIHRRDR